MPSSKRSVLITGCSDGALGAALAIALHEAGLKVYATARNESKMSNLKSLGIETLELDVLSEVSVKACVGQLASLDMLINNAGTIHSMPTSDLSIAEAKKLFDLNVWSYLTTTQAFLPLLLQSKGTVVHHTSLAGATPIPFQSTYNASKAAMSIFSATQRLELQPFGVKVIDLKSGTVQSNIFNAAFDAKPKLPENSIYAPARDIVEKTLRQEDFAKNGIPQDQWAKAVVQKLLMKNPPPIIYKGDQALLGWFASCMPFGLFDGTLRSMTGLDKVDKALQRA